MILFSILFYTTCLSQFNQPNQYSQEKEPLKVLQGIWKIEDDLEAYMIFEDKVNYSIVNLDGNVIIRKRLFGFMDSIPKDSIDIRKLKNKGLHFIIFTGKYNVGKYIYNRHADYSYDLDNDYFIYYGNNPNSFNRIDSLPDDIQKVFDRKKTELNNIKFLENQ